MGGGHHYPFLGIWQYNITRNQKIHKLSQTSPNYPKIVFCSLFSRPFLMMVSRTKTGANSKDQPTRRRPNQSECLGLNWSKGTGDSKHPNFETFGSESQARFVPASGFVTAYVRRLDISLFTSHSHVLVPSPVGFLSILEYLRYWKSTSTFVLPQLCSAMVQWCICLGQVVIFWDSEEDGISTLWRFWVSFHKWGYPKIEAW